MSRKQNFSDSEDDEKLIRQIGNMRYLKKKHEKTIKESMKGVYNEEFIEKMKECKLSGTELKFLNDLEIVPFHQVPPQHKIEHQAGSRVPTQKEREEFENIIPIQSGPFTTKEDKRIVKNWIKFCKKHDWDYLRPEPFLYMRFAGRSIIPYLPNRIAFVQILARKLPNRTLYSVYHRFRNLNSNHKICRYSQHEDFIILEHIRNSNEEDEKTKYATLAKLLNRTRMSIWRRCQILKQGDKNSKIKRKSKRQRLEEMEELNNEKSEDILLSSSESSEADENYEKLKSKKKEPVKRGRKKKNPEKNKKKEEVDNEFTEEDEDNDLTTQNDEI